MPGIVSWGCYIPKYRIKIEDIAKASGNSPAQIRESLHVSEKSLPGIDEDTATIAVEAARNCLAASGIPAAKVNAIFIGSESHPYAVKPTGTIVAEAIGMGNDYMCADLEFACKAGTAAIQIALGLVESGMADYALAGGADTAQAAPGDMLEYTAAAGGAVFLLGKKDACAEIKETVSFSSDTPDFWRGQGQKYPSHGGSFTGEPAYFRHIEGAAKLLFEKTKTAAKDYDYAVFHQPNGKFPRSIAKRLGFSKEQIMPGILSDRIGNTYSGSSLLGLCNVLDMAKPGQKIFLVSYGSGAGSDGFSIEVTDNIIEIKKKAKKLEEYIKDKIYLDYPAYLKNTGKL